MSRDSEAGLQTSCQDHREVRVGEPTRTCADSEGNKSIVGGTGFEAESDADLVLCASDEQVQGEPCTHDRHPQNSSN